MNLGGRQDGGSLLDAELVTGVPPIFIEVFGERITELMHCEMSFLHFCREGNVHVDYLRGGITKLFVHISQ